MSSNNPLLSPDAQPGGVRRANSLPILILIGITAIVCGTLIWVGAERQEEQVRREQAAEKGPDRGQAVGVAKISTDILGEARTGIVVAEEPTPAEPAPTPAVSISIARGDNPPPPPPRLPAADPAFARSREGQIKAFEGAVNAASQAKGTTPNAARPETPKDQLAQIQAARQHLAIPQGNPGQAFSARLAELRLASSGVVAGASGESSTASSQTALASANRAARSDVGQFDRQEGVEGTGDRWSLNSSRKGPPTPYTVTAGASVIPAMLTRGINSELPGQISAMVIQNVYDTATGKHLLVPYGTQLAGMYSSQVVYGQSAVLSGWQRMIFPDGSTLDLGSMPGADAGGYAGFRDLVDNHYLRIYGSALLMSGIVAGVAMSQPQSNNSNNRTTASDAMSEALGQQLGQVSAQQISKNLNIAPTLEIRAGYQINVIPTKDLVFTKPYTAFDY